LMLSGGHLLAFAVTAFVVIAVPGPSVMFTISRALTIGRRGALLTVVGNAAGAFAQVVAVAFGIGALVERSIVAFTAIKLVGVAYLIYLGVHAIRHRDLLSESVTAQLTSDSGWAIVAGSARNWFARSPRRLAAIGGAGGLAMIGVGVALAVSGRKD
jgi:threonine/homoserine/homoserine lactone efflux protein